MSKTRDRTCTNSGWTRIQRNCFLYLQSISAILILQSHSEDVSWIESTKKSFRKSKILGSSCHHTFVLCKDLTKNASTQHPCIWAKTSASTTSARALLKKSGRVEEMAKTSLLVFQATTFSKVTSTAPNSTTFPLICVSWTKDIPSEVPKIRIS